MVYALGAGYNVKAAVRSQAKADAILAAPSMKALTWFQAPIRHCTRHSCEQRLRRSREGRQCVIAYCITPGRTPGRFRKQRRSARASRNDEHPQGRDQVSFDPTYRHHFLNSSRGAMG